MEEFSYEQAFQSNIGLLTKGEQSKLRDFTIAIPGIGGVGGYHLISLVRQGFERFKLSDFDSFEIKNFNRQYGADLTTIDREKTLVMQEKALQINPCCSFEIFDKLSDRNLESFLQDSNLVIDSLDAFEVEVRRNLINGSVEREIPIISAAPIGFGSVYLIFLPKGPNFDEYFGVNPDNSYNEKLSAFFVGLTPKLIQRAYVEFSDLKNKKGPSSVAGVELCAGVATTEAIKILLDKGDVKAVPYYHQFDAMQNKYVCKKLRFGNKGPFQRIKRRILRNMLED